MFWPYPPLVPMTEGLAWRTDVLRPYAREQRVRLLDIPRRTFSHEYRWTPRQYERARAALREQLPGPLDVPDWSDVRFISAAAGATSISFDNSSPQYAADAALAVVQDDQTWELLTVTGGDASGITCSALTNSYADAALVAYLECDAAEGLGATRSVQPYRDAQIEWTSYTGTDIADDGGAPTYRSLPVLTQCSALGDGSVAFGLTHPFQTVDNGLARPYVDTVQDQPQQRFGAAWQPTTRADAYALRQWFHYLKGRQRAFWIPDMNQGLTLAANITAGAGTISIVDVGFSSGYASGDLFIRTTSGTVYTIQVASSVDAGSTETLTLTSPAPANIATSDIDQFCLMICVRLSSDRVEWLHRAKPGPKVVCEVVEVPVP